MGTGPSCGCAQSSADDLRPPWDDRFQHAHSLQTKVEPKTRAQFKCRSIPVPSVCEARTEKRKQGTDWNQTLGLKPDGVCWPSRQEDAKGSMMKRGSRKSRVHRRTKSESGTSP